MEIDLEFLANEKILNSEVKGSLEFIANLLLINVNSVRISSKSMISHSLSMGGGG